MEYELELLLDLHGASYEVAEGYVVEFTAVRTRKTVGRPHGVEYALVFRSKHGAPFVRFDNAHSVPHRGSRFARRPLAYDHWHRTGDDPGRPYAFSTAAQLLDDFWREVRRSLRERGIDDAV